MRRKVNLKRLQKLNDIKAKDLGIDKHGVQYLKYRDMAIEFIKLGYNNIRGIYKKYYPKASDNSIDCEAYRLLDNDRFKIALEEAWTLIKIEDLDIARDVVLTLHKIMLNGKNDSDKINAASWLGKKEAMFTDRQETVPVEKEDSQFSLDRLAGLKKVDN